MDFCCFIVALFMLVSGHLTDTSSALRIDIMPPSYTEESEGSANVTCSLDYQDTGVDEIFMMEIEKAGNHQPLVFIRHSGIQLGAGISDSSKFQIEGLLADDVTKSYVKLVILDPSKEDQGTYMCKMLFSGPTGIPVEQRASSNFTVDKLDLNDVVRDLLGKVASLEKKLDLQTGKVDDLTDRNANLSRELAEKVHDLDSKLDDKVSKVKDEIYNQSLEISQIAEKVNYSVAFSAGIKSNVNVANGNVAVFDDVQLNEGNAYDASTGVFTVPRTGLYAFDLSISLACLSCQGRARIVANNVVMAGVFAYDGNSYYEQSSVSCASLLHRGDQVKVVSNYNPTKLSPDVHGTLFSGHLVNAYE